MKTKNFHLGDILSITTGILMPPNTMDGIYEILDFMTGESLMTHQLPRVANECKPYLLKQFPQLASIDATTIKKGEIHAWLLEQTKKYGTYLTVQKLPTDAHERIDAKSELAEKIHPDRIFEFKIPTPKIR